MSYEARLIAPFNSGLIQYYVPYLIGNDAFTTLDNAYSWRGTVKKREGSYVLGRIPQYLTITGITNASPPQITTSTAHNLSANAAIWIEGSDNAAFNNQNFLVNTVTGANTFTIKYLDGTAIPASGVGTTGNIFLYVEGLKEYILNNGDEQLIAFTCPKTYLYDTGTAAFIDISFFQTSGAAITWTGGRDDMFWAKNFAGALWATNNVDPLRFWNGSSAQGWNNQRPTLNGTTLLQGCLLCIPYKGRLVVLNTREGNAGPGTNFRQRARWCQLGTPYVPASGGDPAVVPPAPYATDANAWRDDIGGRGGYIDADTSENIVSCGIVQDTLIVGFQYSTWRLRYTGNEQSPFIWERINTQFGSECTFSSVENDDNLMMISRRGIVAAMTNGVDRIDMQIPDIVNEIFIDQANTIGLKRVWGLRDYQKQLIYWIWADADNDNLIPNKMYCYNYLDKCWATFSISLTCLSRFKKSSQNTWATWLSKWAGDQTTWQNPLDQFSSPLIVGGRYDGNVWVIMDNEVSQDGVDSTGVGTSYNFDITTKRFNPYVKAAKKCRLEYFDIYGEGETLNQINITGISAANPAVVTTAINHNLVSGDLVTLKDLNGMYSFNNVQYQVTVISPTTFSIPANTTGLTPVTSGTVQTNAEITVQYFVDDDDDQPVLQKKVNLGQLAGDSKYVRVFLGSIARFHQIRMTLSNGNASPPDNFKVYPPNTNVDNELSDTIAGREQFKILGLVIHTRPAGRIRQ